MKFEFLGGGTSAVSLSEILPDLQKNDYGKKPRNFLLLKRTVDVGVAVAALPAIAVLYIVVACLNPLLNPGPVLFRQVRMGQAGRPFVIFKFRTMLSSERELRAHDARVEEERITLLGHFLRTYRIDELPNFINVLRGEMSFIGPRPDAYEHARIYLARIALYRRRYQLKPGITGLAQVRGGYADTGRAVERKARWDNFYIQNASLKLDGYILLQTLRVIATGFGAK